jgi:hypothetical protein
MLVDSLEMILTMAYSVQYYWAYGVYPSSGVQKRKQKNTTFRRLDLSRSSGVWDKIKPTQFGQLEGVSLNH